MNADQQRELKIFFRSLKDRPLEPHEPQYEPGIHQRPDDDPMERLATSIDWHEDDGSVHLLSGQRGAGKSTELRRLRKLLKEMDCTVFLADMRDYLNLTQPLEISDFLISVVGALNDLVVAQYDKDFSVPSYWERFVNFMKSEVKLEPAGIKLGADIKAGLKQDPYFKKDLQKKLRGHVAQLSRHAHDFVADIIAFIRKHEKVSDKKVVLLVDSVEQIRGVGEEAENVYRSVENLFSSHAPDLCFKDLHVVYTVPPYLPPLSPALGRHLGGDALVNLPNVHVRLPDGKPDPAGLAVMRNMLARRYKTWGYVFSQAQIDRLFANSGGDLRDAFRLLRQVLTNCGARKDIDLPVPDSVIDEAENALRREMLPISKTDRAWLERISETHQAELQENTDLARLAHFFDTNLVQCFRNGKDWYDIHPLLKSHLQEQS
ncbi:MAG: hypothetical protein QNK37_02725 [Acidobacteriota bacterium]|nr:hypothetical protein [Acidobacteriota bacterium]